MTHPHRPALAALAAALTFVTLTRVTPARAAPRIAIPPGLQAAALLCVGEALKLCPGALKASDHGLACLRAKRRLLSAPCRGVYDQGLSFLRGGDVHLDLRALRGTGALRSRSGGMLGEQGKELILTSLPNAQTRFPMRFRRPNAAQISTPD